MDKKFLDALSDIIRESITRKEEVSIDGLGVFKPKHRRQFQQQFDNGRVVMMPPADTLQFVPDNSFLYDDEQ